MFHRLQVLGMNDDLWDRVREVGTESKKKTRCSIDCKFLG